MILSGKKIQSEIENGEITITPYKKERINPNSYNLTLHDELLVYKDNELDMRKHNEAEKIKIPKEGFLLKPGELYLGRTVEHTETKKYVPMLEGRSSIGRLGIFIHVTAGFGDVGFSGTWTLEISAIKPVIIYPNIEVGQIYFHTIDGDYELYKSGKYQNQKDIKESMMYKDFEK